MSDRRQEQAAISVPVGIRDHLPRLRAGSRLNVYVALACRGAADGFIAVSVADLARDTGVYDDTVSKVVRQLVDDGFVDKQVRSFAATAYRLRQLDHVVAVNPEPQSVSAPADSRPTGSGIAPAEERDDGSTTRKDSEPRATRSGDASPEKSRTAETAGTAMAGCRGTDAAQAHRAESAPEREHQTTDSIADMSSVPCRMVGNTSAAGPRDGETPGRSTTSASKVPSSLSAAGEDSGPSRIPAGAVPQRDTAAEDQQPQGTRRVRNIYGTLSSQDEDRIRKQPLLAAGHLAFGLPALDVPPEEWTTLKPKRSAWFASLLEAGQRPNPSDLILKVGNDINRHQVQAMAAFAEFLIQAENADGRWLSLCGFGRDALGPSLGAQAVGDLVSYVRAAYANWDQIWRHVQSLKHKPDLHHPGLIRHQAVQRAVERLQRGDRL